MLPHLLLALIASSDASGIAWIEDDWAAAKKTALAKKQLVAVDVWATWCHTCLSMKSYALKEAPMARVKDQLTWLALDYDKEINAPFFEQFPAVAFPVFMVIDPKTERVVARWVGSGTAEEMASFFAEAGRSSEDALSRGHLAMDRGDYAKARQILESALTKERLDRSTRSRIVNALVEVLGRVDPAACARKLAPYIDQVEDSAQGLDAVAMMVPCANALKDEEEKTGLLRRIAARLDAATAKPSPLLAVDDSSAYLGTMIEIYDELEESAKAESAVKRRVALLEGAAKAAKTHEARSTFDYHRTEAYVRLKRYDDAIAMLTASEKAQPKDFNHPWRLANVYLAKGDYDRGLAAIDRALANGYGGRKLRLYSTKIDLLVAKKDLAAARAVVAEGREHIARTAKNQLRGYWKKEFESKVDRVNGEGRGAGGVN